MAGFSAKTLFSFLFHSSCFVAICDVLFCSISSAFIGTPSITLVKSIRATLAFEAFGIEVESGSEVIKKFHAQLCQLCLNPLKCMWDFDNIQFHSLLLVKLI